jgi:hypothetical protein
MAKSGWVTVANDFLTVARAGQQVNSIVRTGVTNFVSSSVNNFETNWGIKKVNLPPNFIQVKTGGAPVPGPAGAGEVAGQTILEDLSSQGALSSALKGSQALENTLKGVAGDAATNEAGQVAADSSGESLLTRTGSAIKTIGNDIKGFATSWPVKAIVYPVSVGAGVYVGGTLAGKGIATVGNDIGQAAYNAEQGILTGIGFNQSQYTPIGASPSSSGTPSAASTNPVTSLLSEAEPVVVIAGLAVIAYLLLTRK